ncbi:hypothetical protein GPECTOR_38g320 [Gonium pectorale]|uniref:Uncharacterized protein n=1 Tax=Gonium pectorale TaxID=33097 RepID=A0A150GBC6_GONPE|nr:hypothetical protein GPECTOR_38g320 [Gonium pectorale]|eukprot:KXZ47083.1 hypothetical protein GPECTOR_38g320 [Gonium pectorale]
MAAGNYDAGKALMEEAVRAREHVGYARAQAAAAREALQRLTPDLDAARERADQAVQRVQELSQRQEALQDTTVKQRKERLLEEANELAALQAAAENASIMHDDMLRMYEDRLNEGQTQYDTYISEGKAAEAEALKVQMDNWRELRNATLQSRDASRAEAAGMKSRLDEINKLISSDEFALGPESRPLEDFEQLRGAVNRSTRATEAVALLARELAAVPSNDPAADGNDLGTANDALLLQTELHHQRAARLAQQLNAERHRLGTTNLTASTQRLLNEAQANVSVEELRKTWAALEQEANSKADEAVRLEEQALALEHAGKTEEAASIMAQAEKLHRLSEELRVEADKAKAALQLREKVAADAQVQSRYLVQGLHDVEKAAEQLQNEISRRG